MQLMKMVSGKKKRGVGSVFRESHFHYSSICSISGVESYRRKGCDGEFNQPSMNYSAIIGSAIFDRLKVIISNNSENR